MPRGALETYLHDHLAGSVGAVEMVERAIAENEGDRLAVVLAQVLADIREDQEVLRRLLAGLGAGESPLKKAGAWLMEKAGRLKLGDTGEAAIQRFEMLEALSLGILGKLALWRALQRVADRHPALREVDLAAMERRALEQHQRIEGYRLEAAREAL
jgi:hypothetical protein